MANCSLKTASLLSNTAGEDKPSPLPYTRKPAPTRLMVGATAYPRPLVPARACDPRSFYAVLYFFGRNAPEKIQHRIKTHARRSRAKTREQTFSKKTRQRFASSSLAGFDTFLLN